MTVLAKTGNTYAVLPCTSSGGTHSFSLSRTGDTEIILVYRGDADLNGKVNMRDSLAIKKHTDGTHLLGGLPLLAANANGDAQGRVDMRDCLAIKKDAAGSEAIAW